MEKNLAFVIILTMYHNTEQHLVFVAYLNQGWAVETTPGFNQRF